MSTVFGMSKKTFPTCRNVKMAQAKKNNRCVPRSRFDSQMLHGQGQTESKSNP